MIVGPCCCLSRHERGVRPTPYLCAPLERDAEAVKPFLTLDGRVASSHYGIVRNLPGGTVTFLFTDVEGSTRLLQELGDGYAEASGGGALVVRGEAGIGKSTLLEAAALRTRERDETVVSATGIPSEARFAFAGLRELLLPFLETRDRLPRPQRRALGRGTRKSMELPRRRRDFDGRKRRSNRPSQPFAGLAPTRRPDLATVVASTDYTQR
jgi:hypothetical protein